MKAKLALLVLAALVAMVSAGGSYGQSRYGSYHYYPGRYGNRGGYNRYQGYNKYQGYNSGYGHGFRHRRSAGKHGYGIGNSRYYDGYGSHYHNRYYNGYGSRYNNRYYNGGYKAEYGSSYGKRYGHH